MSVLDAYRANYRRIAADHIAHWLQTGENPFQSTDVVRATNAATLAKLRHHVPPGAAVLDAGCGMGEVLRDAPEYQRHGVDLATGYLAIAAGYGITTAEADLEALPYPDGTFDAVLLLDVLEHVMDPNPVIAECLRVLGPRGIIIARVPAVDDMAGYEDFFVYEFAHLRRWDGPTMRLLFERVFRCVVLEVEPVAGELYIVARKARPITTCLVTHDRLAYTKRAVASWGATARRCDRLVIVDNASTDGTQDYLATLPVPVILNDTNRYPGAACNQGWDFALERWSPELLHRSDNDIEFLPGWADEAEAAFIIDPSLALLGVLNLHEDRDLPFPGGEGIEPVARVGGNVVMPARLFAGGLRWHEGDWAPGRDEDGPMSHDARRYGHVARLGRTVANNMAFGRYDDFPAYYDRTAAVRGIPDARHSV